MKYWYLCRRSHTNLMVVFSDFQSALWKEIWYIYSTWASSTNPQVSYLNIFHIILLYENINYLFSPMEELIDTWGIGTFWILAVGWGGLNERFLVLKVKCLWSLAAGLLTSSADMIDRLPDATCYYRHAPWGVLCGETVRVLAFQNTRVCWERKTYT